MATPELLIEKLYESAEKLDDLNHFTFVMELGFLHREVMSGFCLEDTAEWYKLKEYVLSDDRFIDKDFLDEYYNHFSNIDETDINDLMQKLIEKWEKENNEEFE